MGLAAVKHDPPPNELERAALEMHQKALEQQKTAPTPSIDDYADAIYSTMKKLITVTIDKRVRELETRLQVLEALAASRSVTLSEFLRDSAGELIGSRSEKR